MLVAGQRGRTANRSSRNGNRGNEAVAAASLQKHSLGDSLSGWCCLAAYTGPAEIPTTVVWAADLQHLHGMPPPQSSCYRPWGISIRRHSDSSNGVLGSEIEE